MSGIVGFIDKNTNKEHILNSMLSKLHHRGPDGQGKYVDEHIALGIRQQNIDNPTPQPVYNETNALVIFLDGEIYNYQALGTELQQKGHAFKTNSPAEVLLHGYEEYKEELLPKLRGMFAFFIWDRQNLELFATRDMFGIKPFYYGFTRINHTPIWGSEIKSFIEHPDFVRSLNNNALENYLTFQYSPTNQTFFEGIHKLMPGTFLKYKAGEFITGSYHDIEFYINPTRSEAETIDEIHNTMQASVNTHKPLTVEPGILLFDDVNSTYLTCLGNLKQSYTVGFDIEGFSEINQVQELATKIGMTNYNKIITKKDYFDILGKVQYTLDEPSADPSLIALYLAVKEAKSKTKVIYAGVGANEIFGGYPAYQEPTYSNFYNKLPNGIKKTIAKLVTNNNKPLNRFLISQGVKVEERYIGKEFIFNPKELKQLLKIKTEALSFKDITKPYFDKVSKEDDIIKMQFLDLHLWLPNNKLLPLDKITAAHSLELRTPYLDKEVMALGETIPSKLKVTSLQTKYTLRLAAGRVVPTDVNQKRSTLSVPISLWLKDDEVYSNVQKTFLSLTAKEYFNHEYLLNLLEEHKKGKVDHSKKIWTIYTFLIWYSEYYK